MIVKEAKCGDVEWINEAQERGRALVGTLMKLRAPKNVGNLIC
jgi:hypothetical protein